MPASDFCRLCACFCALFMAFDRLLSTLPARLMTAFMFLLAMTAPSPSAGYRRRGALNFWRDLASAFSMARFRCSQSSAASLKSR